MNWTIVLGSSGAFIGIVLGEWITRSHVLCYLSVLLGYACVAFHIALGICMGRWLNRWTRQETPNDASVDESARGDHPT